MPKVSWWGGHFEKLIGVIKQALYKSLGRTSLRWSELEEVLLDVEINVNNRPLTYIEEDIQYPILTPNSMILGRDTKMVDGNMTEDEEEDISWQRQQKYVKRCKDAAWRRWQREYVIAVRERHNTQYKFKAVNINVGDVVMINGESKKREKWKIGIISEGKDDQIRGARVKTPSHYLDRPIQLLYTLEPHCNRYKTKTKHCRSDKKKLNVKAKEFRPKRTAGAIASAMIKDIVMYADSDND